MWRWNRRKSVLWKLTRLQIFSFKEAPTNKLLYAKDIPLYKKEVKAYYKAIRDLPPLTTLEVEEFLSQESMVRLRSGNFLCFHGKCFKKENYLTQTVFCFRNTKMNLMRKWP